MGKFLGKLVLIGAAIAINFVPGVGQAITGAVYGTLAGGAVGTAAAAALTFGQVLSAAITLGVTAAGIQSLSGILGLGPSAPKPDTTETAVKTSRPVRVSGYGLSRLYGAYILYETAGDGTAVDVFAVHDGQMDGLVQLYLGDDLVTLTGNQERKRQAIIEVCLRNKVHCVDTMTAVGWDMSVEPVFDSNWDRQVNRGVWTMDGLHPNEFGHYQLMQIVLADAGVVPA